MVAICGRRSRIFDVHIPHPQLQTQTPSAHHFRSLTLGDVDTYLLSKWEQCQEEKIELPAQYIRTYQTNGDSNSIISNPVSLIPCSSREPSQSAQVRPPLSLTPCSSREPGQPAQVRPPLSLTPCSSREPGQPAQVRPPLSLTPCSSREPGQPAQVQPPLSLTPCSSREPGQPAQVRPPLSLTPCSSHEPGQPAQVRPPLSLTPCSSREPGQPAQIRPPLSLSSRPSTKLLASSKLGPRSSLAKLVFQVLPKNKHDQVIAFDQLRSEVKSAKTSYTLSHISLPNYQTASTNLKQELLGQFIKNSETIQQYQGRESGEHSAYVKQLQHKNNILKKILAHEWNTSTTIST